jgi:hypothetical protein
MDIEGITKKNLKEECFIDKRGYLLKYKDRRNDVINKTLNETFNDDEYKYLAFAQRGSQVTIQIIKK